MVKRTTLLRSSCRWQLLELLEVYWVCVRCLSYESVHALFCFMFLMKLNFIFKLFSSSGALFNQLTFYIAYWRRNYLHKNGNRVKVGFWCSQWNLCFSNSAMLLYGWLQLSSCPFLLNPKMQIIEACLISLITSIISFGLPLLRKCSPCPEADPDSGIECPRPPGMYGNYVNVRCWLIIICSQLFWDDFFLSFLYLSWI